VAWSRELSSSPFAAAPLIADIDADGELDVAVTSFTGDIHIVRGSDSQHVAGSYWPVKLTDVSVHSSPLQVCTTPPISAAVKPLIFSSRLSQRFLSDHLVVWGVFSLLFVCLFVRLLISQQRKKIGALNFACMFQYYLDRSPPILEVKGQGHLGQKTRIHEARSTYHLLAPAARLG